MDRDTYDPQDFNGEGFNQGVERIRKDLAMNQAATTALNPGAAERLQDQLTLAAQINDKHLVRLQYLIESLRGVPHEVKDATGEVIECQGLRPAVEFTIEHLTEFDRVLKALLDEIEEALFAPC